MGRRRKPGNDIYPAGVYPSRGWLFYRAEGGAWAKICRIEEWDNKHPGSKAARDRWTELSTGNAKAGTVADLLDAHMSYREQLLREGRLAKRTYEDNLEYLKPLKKVFGPMPAHTVTSRHCAAYVQRRSWQPKPTKGANGELVEQAPRRAPVRANKELSLLSSAYTWALTSPDFTAVIANPCVGVERNPTKAKERCPELWEIEAAKRHAPPPWHLILDLAYIAGSRGVQLRLLPKRAIRPTGLLIGKAKGGADVELEWSDELVAVMLGLLAYGDEITERLHIESPYVILSSTGSPYTAAGWKTMMYKIVRAAIADQDNPLQEPFSFHTIRARSATDEEEIYGTNPQYRLGHKRRATTDDYMRGRRAKRVKPLPLRKAS